MSSFAPEAPAPAPVPPMPDKPAFVVKGWHWVVSILIPFIGIVLGIIAIAKNQIGKGIGLIAVSFTSWLLCFIVFAALAASGTATALESANAGSLAPAADVAPAVEEPVEAPAPVEDYEAAPVEDYESAADYGVDATELVNIVEPLVEPTCELNALMGGGDAGYEDFAAGYGDGSPSAREVWNEIMSRC